MGPSMPKEYDCDYTKRVGSSTYECRVTGQKGKKREIGCTPEAKQECAKQFCASYGWSKLGYFLEKTEEDGHVGTDVADLYEDNRFGE